MTSPHWMTRGLLASERAYDHGVAGNRFDTLWVQRGSGTWSAKAKPQQIPAEFVMTWNNQGATGLATVEAPYPYADTTYGAGGRVDGGGQSVPGDVVSVHTVSVRLGSGDSAVDSIAIGPATCIIQDGSNAGICYAAIALVGEFLAIVKVGPSNAVTTLALQAGVRVRAGDVLSLSYQEDLAGAYAQVDVLLNGRHVIGHTDSSSPYLMSLGGRMGMLGSLLPVIAPAAYGEYATEWWAVNHAVSAEKLAQAVPSAVGDVHVHIMRHQPLSTSPAERAVFVLGPKEVEAVEFSHHRYGGLGQASIRVALQDWPDGERDKFRDFVRHPLDRDWENVDWVGGDVVINCKYTIQTKDLTGNFSETIYRGRMTTVDSSEAVVDIRCESHAKFLDATFVEPRTGDFDAGVLIAELVADSAVKGIAPGAEYPLSGVSVILPPALSGRSISVEWDSPRRLAAALKEILERLSPNLVWGVGGIDGRTFYVAEVSDWYSPDLVAAPYSERFPVYREAELARYRLRNHSSELTNDVTVYGDADSLDVSEVDRPKGRSTCSRSIAMVGRRAQVETNTNALDRGTAARLAQAICKSRCAPQVEAAITHVGPFRGLRTFWHALQPANAWVGISERDNPNANYPAPDADTTPLQNDGMLRRYGDLQIHSLQSEGEGESLPVVASDQALNKGWVLHASLDFNRSNTAGASNKAFILGRPNGADLGGWGGLWWDEQTTRLEWWFTDSTATLRGPINTGILVPNTTPNQVVHLTMFRDDAGNWHFWNGAGFVGTVTGFAQDIVNDASDWRFFDSGVGGRAAWAGAIQNWWLLQASSSNMGQSLDSVNQLAVLSSNQGLRRFFGGGLLRYAKFNEPRVRTAGTGDLPPPRCWTFDGTSRYAADFAGSAFVGNGVSFAFNVGRGYRIPRADERSVTRQRRWGAPVVFSVDRVTYTIEPGTGMITTAFRAGRPQSSLTRTLSDLEAQTEGIQTRLRESSNA